MSIVVKAMPKVTDESYEGQVTVGKRTAHKLILETEDKRVVIIIDSEHNLPLSIEQYDKETGILFDGGYFENIKLNPQLDDSLFQL
jgi:outer membrane lipoprotein-sorting protein